MGQRLDPRVAPAASILVNQVGSRCVARIPPNKLGDNY